MFLQLSFLPPKILIHVCNVLRSCCKTCCVWPSSVPYHLAPPSTGARDGPTTSLKSRNFTPPPLEVPLIFQKINVRKLSDPFSLRPYFSKVPEG